MRESGLVLVVEHRGDSTAVSRGGGDTGNSCLELAEGQVFP